jgi:hypothetical protein
MSLRLTLSTSVGDLGVALAHRARMGLNAKLSAPDANSMVSPTFHHAVRENRRPSIMYRPWPMKRTSRVPCIDIMAAVLPPPRPAMKAF